MRKSKLETYEDILQILVNEPDTLDGIAYKTEMECTVLNQRLDFLIKNELIEERPSDKTVLYAITERGTAVIKALNFQKYLTRISSTIKAIDEALQTIPEISKHTAETQRED